MQFEAERHEVVATCLKLANKGYLAGTGGNIAYRIDEGLFAVTPSATDYYAMGPEDICVLRLGDLARVAGDRRPSVESGLHDCLLRARQDCRASIHTHQPLASAYALLGRPLEILHSGHRVILGPRVAVAAYAPSGTRWLAGKLKKVLRPEVHAYLLRNHGSLCCGRTLAEAVARVEALELACAAFFRDAIARRAGKAGESSWSEVLTLLVQSEEVEPAR